MIGTQKKSPVLAIAMGGVFAALFFVASNLLPPIYVVEAVPITLQVLLVALMAAVLGTRGGLMTLGAVYFMTLCGIPMMSAFTGGVGAFLKPTGGFIIGWIFLVLCLGLYMDYGSVHIPQKGSRFFLLDLVLFCAFGSVGLLLQYLCGSIWMAVYSGSGTTAVPALFAVNTVSFFLFDLLKIIAAFFLARAVQTGLRHIDKKQH